MNNNVAIIISSDGTEYNIKERNNETFHYQLFERINNEVIPGITEDLLIDLRAFSGYNLSIATAAKEYIIIMKWNLNKSSKDLILAVPSKITEYQHDRINEILKKLKNVAVYLFVCEKNEKIDLVFTTPIASYNMGYQEEKNIDRIKEISILEQNSRIKKYYNK